MVKYEKHFEHTTKNYKKFPKQFFLTETNQQPSFNSEGLFSSKSRIYYFNYNT